MAILATNQDRVRPILPDKKTEDCPFAQVPQEIALKIFTELDVYDVGAVRLVCRDFKNQTEDSNFWRDLLIKALGEEKAKSIPLEKCKQVYQRSLPNQRLLPNSEILFQNGMDTYINSLSPDQLREAFCKSAELGILPVMRALIKSTRFNEIPSETGLGKALHIAAKNGQLEAMKLILNCERCLEIPVGSLKYAFKSAAEMNKAEAVNLLMSYERVMTSLASARSTDVVNIGFILQGAAEKGCVEVIKLILNCDRFKEKLFEDNSLSSYANFLNSACAKAKNSDVIDLIRNYLGRRDS